MTFCNFVSMNSECYTTEYRPYLSPKGRVYLKVDNEGKPDLKTFDSSFYSAGYTSLTYCHSYTRILSLLFVRAYQSPIEICFKHVTCFASHLFFFSYSSERHSHHVLSKSSVTVIYRNALVRARCRLTACYIGANTAQSPVITWLRDSIVPHFYSSRTHNLIPYPSFLFHGCLTFNIDG